MNLSDLIDLLEMEKKMLGDVRVVVEDSVCGVLWPKNILQTTVVVDNSGNKCAMIQISSSHDFTLSRAY